MFCYSQHYYTITISITVSVSLCQRLSESETHLHAKQKHTIVKKYFLRKSKGELWVSFMTCNILYQLKHRTVNSLPSKNNTHCDDTLRNKVEKIKLPGNLGFLYYIYRLYIWKKKYCWNLIKLMANECLCCADKHLTLGHSV